MGDRWIFLKACRDASFNKDLLNEPNFDSTFKEADMYENVTVGKRDDV